MNHLIKYSEISEYYFTNLRQIIKNNTGISAIFYLNIIYKCKILVLNVLCAYVFMHNNNQSLTYTKDYFKKYTLFIRRRKKIIIINFLILSLKSDIVFFFSYLD